MSGIYSWGISVMYGLFLEAKHYLRYVVAGVSFVGHLDHKFTLMATPETNEQRRAIFKQGRLLVLLVPLRRPRVTTLRVVNVGGQCYMPLN